MSVLPQGPSTMVPSPKGFTLMPVRPRVRYSIVAGWPITAAAVTDSLVAG